MNLEIIKEIIDSGIDTDLKENAILRELSKDEDILLHFIKILRYERDRKKNCMADMQNILADIHMSQIEKQSRWAGGFQEILSKIEPTFRNWKGLIWHHSRGNFDDK